MTSPEENGCNAIEIQSIVYWSKIVKNCVTNLLQYLCINKGLNFMFGETSIAQKEAQGEFTKTSSTLV